MKGVSQLIEFLIVVTLITIAAAVAIWGGDYLREGYKLNCSIKTALQ